MGKTSTLLYIFNNFDESELIYDTKEFENELKEFDHVWNFVNENIKKVPNHVVNNIMSFVKDS